MSSSENVTDFAFDDNIDLNDPDLLRELNQLMGIGPPAAASNPVPKAAIAAPVAVAVAPTIETFADVEDVEIADHELPDLMAELNSLSLQSPNSKVPAPAAIVSVPVKNADTAKISAELQSPVAAIAKSANPSSGLNSTVPKPATLAKNVSPKQISTPLAAVPPVPAKVKQTPVPTVTINTNSTSSIAKPTSGPRLSESTTSLVGSLKELLQKQIDTCTKQASDYYKIGKKDEAVYFHKYKKQFTMDQSLLTPDTKFQRIGIVYNEISVNWDIPLDKLQLSVSSVTQNMNDISGGAFYIHIDSPFSQGPIDSSTIKSTAGASSPIYQNMYPIETSKTYQRYFEKKKVTLEFYMPRFLRSSVFLGKCSIELVTLLRKCSVSGSYQLMDQSGRRGIGVYCDVSIKLHKPLVKPVDMEEVHVTWVIMNEPSFYSYILDTEKQQIPSKDQPIVSTKSSAPNKSNSPRRVASPAPAAPAKITPVKANVPSGELEDLLLQFKSYQSNSNNVLEHMLMSVPPNSSEAEGIKLALSVLVVQVQTGALTIEKYVGMLQDEIKAWRQFALSFKRAGSLEYAKKALEHVKILEAEISSAQNVE